MVWYFCAVYINQNLLIRSLKFVSTLNYAEEANERVIPITMTPPLIRPSPPGPAISYHPTDVPPPMTKKAA